MVFFQRSNIFPQYEDLVLDSHTDLQHLPTSSAWLTLSLISPGKNCSWISSKSLTMKPNSDIRSKSELASQISTQLVLQQVLDRVGSSPSGSRIFATEMNCSLQPYSNSLTNSSLKGILSLDHSRKINGHRRLVFQGLPNLIYHQNRLRNF